MATLCPIWPARDLNLKPPAPETNALPLDQLAGPRLHLWYVILTSQALLKSPKIGQNSYLRHAIGNYFIVII